VLCGADKHQHGAGDTRLASATRRRSLTSTTSGSGSGTMPAMSIGRPRGIRSRTAESYCPPAPIPGSAGLVKLSPAVCEETHRKVWLLAQLMDTTMGDALDRLFAGLDLEAGELPPWVSRPVSPNQLQLSA
jgi:hypothetical protein